MPGKPKGAAPAPPSETLLVEQEVEELRRRVGQQKAAQKAAAGRGSGSGVNARGAPESEETRLLREEIERLKKQANPEPEPDSTKALEEEVRLNMHFVSCCFGDLISPPFIHPDPPNATSA